MKKYLNIFLFGFILGTFTAFVKEIPSNNFTPTSQDNSGYYYLNN